MRRATRTGPSGGARGRKVAAAFPSLGAEISPESWYQLATQKHWGVWSNLRMSY